jgi:hypothetical protein
MSSPTQDVKPGAKGEVFNDPTYVKKIHTGLASDAGDQTRIGVPQVTGDQTKVAPESK